MKWKEGLAIAGALAGDRTGATRIPLDEENKKKNRKAFKKGLANVDYWRNEDDGSV